MKSRGLWLFLGFSSFLWGFEDILEVRAGYFSFANSVARDIYGHGSLDLELENSFRIASLCSVWINGNYTWKKGSSLTIHDMTHLYLITLSLGPKLFFPIKKWHSDFYLGVGITGAYIHIKDQTNYLPSVTNRASVGCVGKSGLMVKLSKHCVLDFFFDYYYQPVRTRKSNSLTESQLNLGGYRTGSGLGYLF